MQERENSQDRIIAVCGIKNSGKTTLIEKLVGILSRQGVKVAVIKHDGHDFSCDIPGTDSHRFSQAGAYGTAVFSDQRMFVHKRGTREREKDLICLFPEADLIFLEGMKDSTYPKIEVIRKEISRQPVSNPTGRFLIVTDLPLDSFQEKTLSLNDGEGILHEIQERLSHSNPI
ncbi:MAG: molybdopterin-guanine dinucleotide biosynthesis protein B [Blautia sp.]|nr:molybdopterin-guanine dinucleotide biosynthesis protein B [Blautia sp.]